MHELPDAICYEDIVFNDEGNIFVFNDLYNSQKYYKVVLDGFAMSFRFLEESYCITYNDKYITKKDIKLLKKYRMCYANESEYIDWFRETSCNACIPPLIYHIHIATVNYVVEFLTDTIPTVIVEEKPSFVNDDGKLIANAD